MVDAKTIKESVKLADVLALYGSPLQNGRAMCPFHQDRHPSLTIKNERWRCWACGERGDAIDFVARLNGFGVQEAMETINRDFNLGFNLRSTRTRPESDQVADRKRKAADYHEYLRMKRQQDIEELSRLHRILSGRYVREGCKDKEIEHECELIAAKLDRLMELDDG